MATREELRRDGEATRQRLFGASAAAEEPRGFGTLLTEAGVNIDIVRRWLGQKTLAMAIHYSDTADTSSSMNAAIKKFDPLGSKRRTKVSNSPK